MLNLMAVIAYVLITLWVIFSIVKVGRTPQRRVQNIYLLFISGITMFAMAPNELWKAILPLFNLALIIAYLIFIYVMRKKG
ncbi:hypothetical protein SAMN04487969_11787 [Paenibacillus algorifonticola]|uniref:Uncharacterized protein n=1 Tax=Paenibacillus algorifonticola TaxID=684063 RepID=A0A1I2GR13_9BACL|nr:hypothetical protein [Paenibacillus algorifonticola]SFF19718.1 hypothetical protein SAMN04487969_11787 [Paenibacillus algorifonticola]